MLPENRSSEKEHYIAEHHIFFDAIHTKMHKLPGLNGLRAIAASLVLIGHVYEIAGRYGMADARSFFARHQVGPDMVNLFFVISGFIITYVLLHEKSRSGTISLKAFYIKRAVRIWPLYFLLLGIVFLVSNFSSLYNRYPALNAHSIVLFSLFAINFNTFFHVSLCTLRHYWSLSVEEQFYLFWPVLFKKFNPLVVAVTVVFSVFLLRNITGVMVSRLPHVLFWQHWHKVLSISRFGSMAIGAIGSLCLNVIKRLQQVLFKKPIQLLAWLVFAASILFKFHIPYIHAEAMALLYLYLILSVTINPHPLLTLEQPFFNKTGAISYGLYMYHYPLVPLLILALQKAGVWNFFTQYHEVPLVLLSYGITYLLATLSYTYFELPILRLKPVQNEKHRSRLAPQYYQGNNAPAA